MLTSTIEFHFYRAEYTLNFISTGLMQSFDDVSDGENCGKKRLLSPSIAAYLSLDVRCACCRQTG